MLMHVEYRVKLPDHDWVVATGHKLIPSVYAGMVIKPDDIGNRQAVSYSGPTYVAIRSGKHSSSTAFSHAADTQNPQRHWTHRFQLSTSLIICHHPLLKTERQTNLH